MNECKNNIILADCVAEEVLPFAETLYFDSQPFVIRSHVANWKRTGMMSELKRYAKYFLVAFKYFRERKTFNAIVGWQQFYALIFCFYCWIFHVKKTNVVIALNFTYKEKRGKIAKLYKWFMTKCMNPDYMDYLHVLSSEYAVSIYREFGFPLDRIIVTSFGVNDEFDKFSQLEAPKEFVKNSYALAIGRSNRDYDFLIDAWKGIDYPLVIISDTYKGNVNADNILLLSKVVGEEAYSWIVNCGLMIVPIDDGSICSGDTVLLTAMSLKRKIVVTKPSTLAEMYVVDGENAVLTDKEINAFRKVVTDVLHSNQFEHLGECARTNFLQRFTRESMGKKVTNFLNSKKQ